MKSPAKLLAEAKNAAGDRAVAAAKRGGYSNAASWRVVAQDIDRVFRDAIKAEASQATVSQPGSGADD